MNIREIWRQVNVSSILILPLYSAIAKKALFIAINEPYPFVQLCFDNGLINTYLFKNNNRSCENFYMVFNKDSVLLPGLWKNIPYKSLNELIIDCPYFLDLELNSNLIIYTLKFPENFKKDIEKITKSNYSNLSKEFEESIKINARKIVQGKSVVGFELTKRNLGMAIIKKSAKLQKELEEVVGNKVEGEIFTSFNYTSETLNKKKIKNLTKKSIQ